VTGAGRGLGKEHALAFAREGAKVVVNDLGVANDGSGADDSPAHQVASEIRAMGGEAIVNGADIADWNQAAQLVKQTIETFGKLDVLVNNAGFVRDRMFVSCSEEVWDAVIRVHLKGHFCITRHAVDYWRAQIKGGNQVDARIINTSSGAGVFGSIGQSSYATAKAGIAALTIVQGAELRRYGITSNAICPIARTRMTEQAFGDQMKAPEKGFDVNDPANVSPFVVWLGSAKSAHVTGRVWEVFGGTITVLSGFHRDQSADIGKRWTPSDIGAAVDKLLSSAQAQEKIYGT
jgi:NAD(P)-dependent dehydrogenase (short-subunit alcohol dehydrogenase family)